MKLLIVSDIHSNKHGLQGVLKAAEGKYDSFLCLGDIVGYGAFPNECCDLVKETIAKCSFGIALQGNHDAACVGVINPMWFNGNARKGVDYSMKQLTPENADWLFELEPQYNGEQFQAVHASLVKPLEEYITDDYIAERSFKLMKKPVCFIGHTHVAEAYSKNTARVNVDELTDGGQVIFKSDTRYIINPGSCGQPRAGSPNAHYAIWDTETPLVEVFSTEYDIMSAAQAIENAGLPKHLADRLFDGI